MTFSDVFCCKKIICVIHSFIASGSFWPVFALYKSHPFIYCLREFLVCFCFVQKSSIHLLPQGVSGLFLLCTKVIHSFIASWSFWPVFALYKRALKPIISFHFCETFHYSFTHITSILFFHFRYSGELQDLIRGLLVVNVMERPYISWVLERVKALLDKAENRIWGSQLSLTDIQHIDI